MTHLALRLCIALLLIGTFSVASPADNETLPNRINVPQMSKAPQINGKLDAGEWDSASGAPVAISYIQKQTFTDSYGARFRIGRHGDNLYLLFAVDRMMLMPVASALERDKNVWQDDSVEFWLSDGKSIIQLVVNSKGICYDALDGFSGWNGPFQIAAGTIGAAFQPEDDGPSRGYLVEVCIPLKKSGMKMPVDGNRWGLQVAMNRPGANPLALWSNNKSQTLLRDSMGELVWGGSANCIDTLDILHGGREQKLTGILGLKTDLAWLADKIEHKAAIKAGKFHQILTNHGGNWRILFENPLFRYDFAGAAETAVPCIVRPIPMHDSFYIRVNMSATNGKPVQLRIVRDGKKLWSTTLSPVKNQQYQVAWANYKNWGTGPCVMHIEQLDEKGKIIPMGQIDIRVPQKPEWADFKIPTTPLAPAPFTPVQADKHSAVVWGREYCFGKTPFLDQVSSQGINLLAAPVQLTGMANGKKIEWKLDSWKLESSDDEKAVYNATAESIDGMLRLSVRATLEFDGMLRLDWEIASAKKSVTIDRLGFIIPMNKTTVNSWSHWKLEEFDARANTGWHAAGDINSNDICFEFSPAFWLGNQKVGIQWFTESRIGWTPADRKKTVEIVSDEKTTSLVLNIIGKQQTLEKPLNFTFGLMASPVRPRPEQCDMQAARYVASGSLKGLLHKTPVWSRIAIPVARDSFQKSQGCLEMDLKLKSPQKDKPSGIMKLARYTDAFGNQLWLVWNPAKKALQVLTQTVGQSEKITLSADATLKPDQWYRLAWNFGKTMEIFVDGKRLAKTEYSAALPKDYWPMFFIYGADGNLSIKAWRISKRPRKLFELAKGTSMPADKITCHLTILRNDPTAMNVADSQVGYLKMPAYLMGSWKYDRAKNTLIAQPDEAPASPIQQWAKCGIKGIILFEWANNILGHGGIADDFAKVRDECHRNGLKVLPYTPEGINDSAPEFKDYIWEFGTTSPYEKPAYTWTEGGELNYRGYPDANNRRRMLYQIDQVMRAGADGMYFDGTFVPTACTNEIQVQKVIDKVTGKPIPVYSFFLKRDMMKEVYKIIKSYQPDGILDLHASTGFLLPSMSMVTSVSNGEAICLQPDWQKQASLGFTRTLYYTRQYGFNGRGLFMMNIPLGPEYGVALMGIHGQTPAADCWGMHTSRATKIWQLAEQFDTETAEWFPYFDNTDSPVHVNDKNVKVSAFVHPGKRALLLVSNWSDKQQTASIEINWKKLELPENTPVRLVTWNKQLNVTNGKITLSLKPRFLYHILVGNLPDGHQK